MSEEGALSNVGIAGCKRSSPCGICRCRSEVATQQQAAAAAQGRVDEAGGQLREVQGRLAHSWQAAEAASSQGDVERALGEAVRTGRIKGKVYGTLGAALRLHPASPLLKRRPVLRR